ncbi:ANTAR domain-containing protein [Streptomyces actuosus]|uniref:Antitermination regulator n=1 Tax=Streptomyces actuosus TaxID=1885 RepID=A0A2U9PBY0_STRAS|nr:antitermination regulator [Streptomyces actuosus]MBM4823779.1 ANTAR domain-containing protein [Streptomyces actuosus]
MPEPGHQAQSPEGDSTVGAAPSRLSAPRAPAPPVIETRPDGDRVLVVVRGELDLDAGRELQHELRAALARSVRGVDLDLAGVGFCDCSALNILLALRERALQEGKTVAVRETGPAAERLLELSGTRALFAGGDGDEEEQEEEPDASAVQDLVVELVQLRRAMQTRPTIDLARGILMATFRLSADDAWTVLVMASQNTNTKLHHLARDLVTAVRGAPLDETVQQQLAAAVARLEPARETVPPAVGRSVVASDVDA